MYGGLSCFTSFPLWSFLFSPLPLTRGLGPLVEGMMESPPLSFFPGILPRIGDERNTASVVASASFLFRSPSFSPLYPSENEIDQTESGYVDLVPFFFFLQGLRLLPPFRDQSGLMKRGESPLFSHPLFPFLPPRSGRTTRKSVIEKGQFQMPFSFFPYLLGFYFLPVIPSRRFG